MRYFIINSEPYHCANINTYVAQDSNGDVYVYTTEPLRRPLYWATRFKDHSFVCSAPIHTDWKNSCRETTE